MDEQRVIKLYAEYDSCQKVASIIGSSASTINRILAKNGIKRTGNRKRDKKQQARGNCGNYKHCPALTVMLYEVGHSTYEIQRDLGIPSGSIDKLCKKGRLKIRKTRNPKLCRPIIVAMYQLTDYGIVLIARHFEISTSAVSHALKWGQVDTSSRKKRNQYGKPNGGRERYNRATNYRNRCAKYGVEFDPNITLRDVFDRDGGVCKICGCATDWTDTRYGFTGPKHPTIDHIIPLSRGGSHTWGNVQLACHQCNSRKGNKVVES